MFRHHHKPVYALSKEVLDRSLSALLLVLASPLFAAITLALRRVSSESVIFRQERVGKDGRLFWFYKFRTMHGRAEQEKEKLAGQNIHNGSPIFKIKHDPRVTRVGKWLRQRSLDELPQLWNVLKGDMSLVGPRPSLPQEVLLYTRRQRKRLTIKPGLTCYWQISGRSVLPFKRWMALDILYVKKRSFLTDLYILAKTLPAVITGIGAW